MVYADAFFLVEFKCLFHKVERQVKSGLGFQLPTMLPLGFLEQKLSTSDLQFHNTCIAIVDFKDLWSIISVPHGVFPSSNDAAKE
jgi:hypothetical protein